MRRTALVLVAGSLAITAATALSIYIYERPTHLRVAVARDSVDYRIMSSIAHALVRDRKGLRLKLVAVSDSAAAAKALETRNADFAVIRSDSGIPADAATAVVMRRSAAILLAPGGAPVHTVGDLKGKRVGVVHGTSLALADNRLLDTILTQYDIPAGSITRVPMTPVELREALKSNRIDAVFLIGVPTTGPVTEIVNIVAAAGTGEPIFVPMEQAKAIAQSTPAYETLSVVAGAFGGAKARPPEEVETIAVSTRLMALTSMKNATVGAFTRAIFALKPRVAASVPLALRMEAPSTDKDAALPVHPGAAAFLDGEEESLFDRFSDYIYLGAMVLSLFGSAIAGVMSWLASDNLQQFDKLFERMLEILKLVRLSEDGAGLKVLQTEADDLLVQAMASGAATRLDSQRLAALGLVSDQIRQAVRDRQRELGSGERVVDLGLHRQIRVGE